MWLPKRFPETNSLIDILITSASDMGTVGYSLQQELPSQFTLSSLLSTNKVQQKLTRQSVKSETQSRIDTTADVREAARLRSLQEKGSEAWLQAISTVRVKTINTFTLEGVAIGSMSRNASVFRSRRFFR